MFLTPSINPFGWDPFADFRRPQTDRSQLFDGTAGYVAAGNFPLVNLWLGEHSVVVTAELPGLSRDDINLTARQDTLTIQGERKPAADGEEVTWHRRERPAGTFSRTLALPFRVDPERVEARFANGVLEVEMQRPKADRPHTIQIKAS